MTAKAYLIINGFKQPLYTNDIGFLIFRAKKDAQQYKKQMKKSWRKRKIVKAFIFYD